MEHLGRLIAGLLDLLGPARVSTPEATPRTAGQLHQIRVTLVYLPDDMAWPEIHITLMLVNWRIQACDAPWSYRAHWCYPGTGIDTFTTLLHHLRQWGGDPHDEPTGWTKRHGQLDGNYHWERQPGMRLDQLGWDAFRPARPKGL